MTKSSNSDRYNSYKSKYTKETSYSENVGNRIPPHSIDAEIAVLGAMMLDKSAVSKVMEILEPDSFYNDNHKEIFKAVLDLSDRGIPADLVSLTEELTRRQKLEEVGGTYYIMEINKQTPTSANVEYHARIIQERFIKRSLIMTATQIIERSYDETTDALDEVDIAESDIFKIAEKRFSSSYVDIKTLSHQALDVIAKLAERDKTGLTGVPTGYTDLDKLTGGFQNSDLIILAARPSMGKTALALSIARNVAVEYNMPVAVFSIEMKDIQLVLRLFSAESQIDAHKIRTGYISHEDMTKMVHKINRLADSPLYIDDSPSLSIADLRAKCRRLKSEHNIKMVIIDYLQLINPPKADSREREISMISSSLKQIAKELDIPIVALAQLNRSVEARPDKKPMLSDLRESGSIEQDADVVLFIHRPEFYGIKTYTDTNTPTENTAEVIIGKQRNGPTDTVRLVYLKQFARFENGDFSHLSTPQEYGGYQDEPDEPF